MLNGGNHKRLSPRLTNRGVRQKEGTAHYKRLITRWIMSLK